MAILLQSIDESKFEVFSKVANEISTKLVSSFHECEVLLEVPDQYDFEFSIKAPERSRAQRSTHMQKIEFIDN